MSESVSEKIKKLHEDGHYLIAQEARKREHLRKELQKKLEVLAEFGFSKKFNSIEEANAWLIKNNKIEELDLNKSRLDITLGYEYIYSPNHPLANASGKVYTHRYVYSKFHNEYVKPDEIIHHIDENKSNNSIENLIKMSNSEHASLHHPGEIIREYECSLCKTIFRDIRRYENVFCSALCASNSQKKFDPSYEELKEMVWKMSTVKVAAHYGVSDKAVEKRCKKLEIDKPPRGYWAKMASLASKEE